MTPEQLEHKYLTLRVWIFRSLTPAAGAVIIALILCMGLSSERLKDQSAVLIGFAALYFVLIRGGHMIMVRSLHKDMLARHEAAYRDKLAPLTPESMPRNISFKLASLKREILDQAK